MSPRRSTPQAASSGIGIGWLPLRGLVVSSFRAARNRGQGGSSPQAHDDDGGHDDDDDDDYLVQLGAKLGQFWPHLGLTSAHSGTA